MEERTVEYSDTLSAGEESRLDNIYHSHCASESRMSLNEFIFLVIEKGVISNRCSLQTVLSVFSQAAVEGFVLSRDRFFACLNLLAHELYPEDFKPTQRLFTQLLTEISVDLSLSALLVFDRVTEALLTEGVIKEFGGCEPGLLQVLMLYNDDNIMSRRKVVGANTVKQKDLGICARNFLRYCRASNLVPHLVNIETLQEFCRVVVPPSNTEQKGFFDDNILLREYELDNNYLKMTPLEKIKGEPVLKLHHISLVLGRVAIEGLPDIGDPVLQVRTLLREKLALGGGQDYGPGCQVTYEIDYSSDGSFSSLESEDKILEAYERRRLLAQRGIKDDNDICDIVKDPPYIPSIQELANMLDADKTPEIPPVPVVQPINPPPYALPVLKFELPKPPVPKGEKRPVAAPKLQSSKKEESAADRLKFVPMPGAMPQLKDKMRYEKFFDLRTNLQKNVHSETFKEIMCNPAVQPCLIREVLLPPPCPSKISCLIESAFVYQNNANYSMALLSLENARTQWVGNTNDLRPEALVFFEFSTGSIYESSGNDQVALGHYYAAKPSSDRLPSNNPDRALVYCGLGSVLCHMGYFALSLRCFLAAKKTRERTIGGDTVDTATAYNNCGASMFGLRRFPESIAYFRLAEAIFDLLLGPHHPRTQTARQNIEKVRRQSFLATPEFKPLWEKQFEDPYIKGTAKKKKKKKK